LGKGKSCKNEVAIDVFFAGLTSKYRRLKVKQKLFIISLPDDVGFFLNSGLAAKRSD